MQHRSHHPIQVVGGMRFVGVVVLVAVVVVVIIAVVSIGAPVAGVRAILSILFIVVVFLLRHCQDGYRERRTADITLQIQGGCSVHGRHDVCRRALVASGV